MNRHEFLKQLEHALEAEMNPAKVREHVDYYRSYIAEEVKNGKSEKEVMDLLGDPWVIARSIIDSPLNETACGLLPKLYCRGSQKWKVREGSDGSSRGSVGDRKVYH